MKHRSVHRINIGFAALGVLAPLGMAGAQEIDFVEQIQPILEFNCVGCHREGNAKGNYRMDTKELAFESGDFAPNIIAGEPEESAVYFLTTLDADDDDLMPPTNKGGPLPKETTDLLKQWIAEGAKWPDDVTLVTRREVREEDATSMDAAQVGALYEHILDGSVEGISMNPYTETIPGSRVDFEMTPIPGGSYVMGSPEDEAGREPHEGPQREVNLDPFWMATCEVTWDQFELFMYPEQEKRLRQYIKVPEEVNELSDAVARPTAPYVEMSFGMGKRGYPAISMTHHGAVKFTEWLSAKTGRFYRLPTEAEWEYAARAGTTTAYYFGDDISDIDEYEWYEANSNWKYQKVGTKKPNPWGLYDMHGNVAEWTLDQYFETLLGSPEGEDALDNPWIFPRSLYPRVVKGGSWDDTPEKLRSAAKRASSADWKIQDPQIPKSIWYHTDAKFLGFRVVRPLVTPTPEQMQKYWTCGRENE